MVTVNVPIFQTRKLRFGKFGKSPRWHSEELAGLWCEPGRLRQKACGGLGGAGIEGVKWLGEIGTRRNADPVDSIGTKPAIGECDENSYGAGDFPDSPRLLGEHGFPCVPVSPEIKGEAVLIKSCRK